MKKWLGNLLLVLLVVGAIAYFARAPILTRVLEEALATRLLANRLADLEDGLHLALCGAGGPLPAPKASGPCVAVVADGQLFIVDAGTDGLRNLGRMSYPAGQVRAVFLTHFHSDHIDGLGELATIRWAAGDNATPLTVYGPKGVERVVNGFNEAYAQDVEYRHAHHGDLVAPLAAAGLVAMPFDKPPLGELEVILEEGELKIEALAVDHSPVAPAVGYRFTYKGRSLLITGDTVKLENIRRFAQGVDLLVHEALAPNLITMMGDVAAAQNNQIVAKVAVDILDYHASPMDAAETARDAGVGHLLYYHIVPPLVVPGQAEMFLDGADDVFPNYTIGEDGVEFSLPAYSTEIVRTRTGL